jgi:hypothetical protein
MASQPREPWRKLENIIKINLRYIGCEDERWMGLAKGIVLC